MLVRMGSNIAIFSEYEYVYHELYEHDCAFVNK